MDLSENPEDRKCFEYRDFQISLIELPIKLVGSEKRIQDLDLALKHMGYFRSTPDDLSCKEKGRVLVAYKWDQKTRWGDETYDYLGFVVEDSDDIQEADLFFVKNSSNLESFCTKLREAFYKTHKHYPL